MACDSTSAFDWGCPHIPAVRRWHHHLIYPRAKGYAFASNLVATLKEWDILAKSPSLGRKYMFRKLNSGVITKGPMIRLGRGCSYTRGYSGTLLTGNYQLKSVQYKYLLFFCDSRPTIQVARQERYEEFGNTLRTLYEGEDDQFFIRAQVEIREQIQFEAAQRNNEEALGHALVE
ncbi:uncharacterized protein K444DRAFT_626809 [Hyaloscypha bicolor E]|uniref:Uncharacterized protein n=1 Tax=Hyaloscypha bicolor E TaxID=1095630 RepID=A0A2J6TJ90_9HELO|nr:uncharacterized protein K444DRAFT_626809 [Hyaloscypha bicolor E]PMD63058.1 hypothetical protein K444DRAFT_626809 [Hyaloscypha bicolor E]